MVELEKDPSVVRAVRPRLTPGETVLWASAQRVLGRRGLLVAAATIVCPFTFWAAAALVMGSPGPMMLFFVLWSPFLLWWLVEMLARSFVATDRRVIFLSRVWPHRWSYWNYAEMDVPLVQVGRGKKIIHLRHFALKASAEPSWVYRLAVYPTYIEQVPDIESVRDLILEQVRRKPEPVELPKKARGSRRTIYGTRTG